MAKKSSASSKPEKLVRMKAENIFSKPLIDFSDILEPTDELLTQMVPFHLRS